MMVQKGLEGKEGAMDDAEWMDGRERRKRPGHMCLSCFLGWWWTLRENVPDLYKDAKVSVYVCVCICVCVSAGGGLFACHPPSIMSFSSLSVAGLSQPQPTEHQQPLHSYECVSSNDQESSQPEERVVRRTCVCRRNKEGGSGEMGDVWRGEGRKKEEGK